MEKEFRVLMVEDSNEDVELIQRELKKIHLPFEIRRVDSKEGLAQALKEFVPQLILSDYRLPAFDGLSALAMAKEQCPSVPFIFVSGAIGEDRAIEALREGATDYVLKDRLSRLVPAVERTLREIVQKLDREKIAEELQRVEARFEDFMDHNPAVAFLKTPEGKYVYANKPFEKHFNLNKADWFGKSDFDLWPQDMAQHMRENDNKMLTVNRCIELTEEVPTPDGIMHSWLTLKFPVNANRQRLIGGIAIDITEQKRAEAQLKQAVGELARLNAELDRKNSELKKLDQLKSDFISTVSHELRTPMTIIRESISQIIDRLCGEVTDVQAKRLNITLNNLDRLKHIVDNLLDISKFESKKVELNKSTMDFVALAKEVMASFEPQMKTKGLQGCYDFSVESVYGSADQDKIIQVLVNLVGNAVKFTERGHIKICVRDNAKEIEFRISDTGPGIQKDDLSKMFNKFEQFGRKEGPGEKGTGLGLAICKEIIKLHHGEIWAESQPGQGAEFTFTLPKFSVKELLQKDLESLLNASSGRVTVLFLEVNNFNAIQKEAGPQREPVEKEWGRVIKQCLRRQDDRVLYNDRFIFIIMPETSKEEALVVSGRIQQSLDDTLLRSHLNTKVEMTVKAAEYPGEGKNAQELLEKTGLL